MTEHTLYSTAEEKKRSLTLRFWVTGLVATMLIVVLITAGGYYLLRAYGLNSALELISEQISDHQAHVVTKPVAIPSSEFDSVDAELIDRPIASEKEELASLARRILHLKAVKAVALYDRSGNRLWPDNSRLSLSSIQRSELADLYSGQIQGRVYDQNFLDANSWLMAFNGTSTPISSMLLIKDSNGKTLAVGVLDIDFSRELAGARTFGFRLFIFVLLGNLILFILLYDNFRNGVKTIERQEQKLNHQIARLSNLLTINKSMQQSMKTASARAVELNEQFLRRVGADLHDGPAQMIGYSVLRLNQVSSRDAAKELGHEFHAIREALDESLDEIRGISSGLVLPELENMSLEQCLRKVVTLHSAKSNSEVTQYYTDIDCDIQLPVKITAYRFVQEGLNNSHRHGQAEKCRITAQVKDGVLNLSLKDNGMGFRMSQLKSQGGHLGLLGMKDRIESLGGKFSINSELGIGTALKLSISLVDDDVT